MKTALARFNLDLLSDDCLKLVLDLKRHGMGFRSTADGFAVGPNLRMVRGADRLDWGIKRHLNELTRAVRGGMR